MEVDRELLTAFEKGLDTGDLATSAVPAVLLGYGEISAIFQLGGVPGMAFKRMPMFSSEAQAGEYGRMHDEYCALLTRAGLNLPESAWAAVAVPGRPVALYIAQRALPPDTFAHRLIHTLPDEEAAGLIRRVAGEIDKVWAFNRRGEGPELALDGQISNWAVAHDRLWFVDTSTPLYRVDGRVGLDPELLLAAAPRFLRWVLRLLFVSDVMNRYFDPRQVALDLAANLFKEGRPDLVGTAVDILGAGIAGGRPLTVGEVKRYYRQDRVIWSWFLAFRRLDRFLKTRVSGGRYDFILPGPIWR